MEDIGTFGGDKSLAADINDFGQIVGWAMESSNWLRAFMYENGVMSDLGTENETDSEAHGVNKAGQVVGYATVAEGWAVRWYMGDVTSLTDRIVDNPGRV